MPKPRLTGKYHIISVRSDKQYLRFCFCLFRRTVIASALFCDEKFQVQFFGNFFWRNVSWNGNTSNNKQHIIYMNIYQNVHALLQKESAVKIFCRKTLCTNFYVNCNNASLSRKQCNIFVVYNL